MAAPPITTVNVSTQKVDIEALYKALIHGLNTELASIDTFVLGSQTISRVDLLSRFQARIDAAGAVKVNRATLQKSVADERALDASVKPVRAMMKTYLQARYGKASPTMQAFGFTQTRKAKTSAQAKAGAVTKAKATRQARGTKGTQQKRGIKGAPAPTIALASTNAGPPAPASPASPVAGTGGTHS